ncbi:MarR family winged helix-turn-helix transcriptional regulator [Frankia sp. AiPa1]|uniref:MarR family winged helix-turn-helix transcriptional regulator n=1 Tax=Frankia sp. AiPa1 TaxID=573492 RepID=UPI00202B2BE2|nr:MarR family winged helix-turn-helix transcriptional regulator [Frankia sp. AiPa1]MCL9758446.1 MarR family winged helix-turn-helix transcriptional regulator [Frankia sp. AiPa1]
MFTTPVALVRLSYLVDSIYADVCSRHGVSVPQAQLMCVLKDQPRGMSEISAMLRLDKSSVTGLVERAERRGYLSRAMSPTDRRAITVSLTPAGKQLTDTFYGQVSQRLTDLAAHLPAADRDQLTRIATLLVLNEDVPDVFGLPTS